MACFYFIQHCYFKGLPSHSRECFLQAERLLPSPSKGKATGIRFGKTEFVSLWRPQVSCASVVTE